MPYIPQPDREKFSLALDELRSAITTHDGKFTGGELNYLITKLGLLYLERHGRSYNTLSDVIKAMECAKLEFARRHLAPHEDGAIERNGDVL